MSHEEDKFINFPFGNTLAYLRNSQYDANLQYLVGSSHWSASSGRSSCSCGVIFYIFLVYNSPANQFVAKFWVLSLIFQIDWRLFIFSTSHFPFSIFFPLPAGKRNFSLVYFGYWCKIVFYIFLIFLCVCHRRYWKPKIQWNNASRYNRIKHCLNLVVVLENFASNVFPDGTVRKFFNLSLFLFLKIVDYFYRSLKYNLQMVCFSHWFFILDSSRNLQKKDAFLCLVAASHHSMFV